MKSTSSNDVRIYDVTASRSMPQFVSDRKRRQMLKKDADLSQRVELVQVHARRG